MKMIAVTGVSSFIGQHLARYLSTHGDAEVHILIHENKPKHVMDTKGIVPVEGDLLKPDTLRDLFEPACTVINLAYLNRSPMRENLDAMENLVKNCIEARIKRLVHCSTAVVVGGVPDDVITEETPCNPKSEYETIKFQIEGLLREKARNHFELVILRPTAVFGPGGRNLLKLAGDLAGGNSFVNYLRSCLFGSRRMNLVNVTNVTSAILFLASADERVDGETFIVSDDEYPENNYRDVEKQLIRELDCREYVLPRIPLPQTLLSHVLRLAGRTNANPCRVYSSEKIRSMGFQKKTSFEAGLTSFAEWYKKAYLPPKQKE
jgi:nucleoside-diphosphate-sugar epimerase